MRKMLPFSLRSVLFSIVFLIACGSVSANHIRGIDMGYSWVSGNTYQVTLTIYGDCAHPTPSLSTARPVICVYNGPTSIGSFTLTVQPPSSGTNVSQVCLLDTGLTTCSGGTLDGTRKYVYTGTYTLTGTSHIWRFIFDGNTGGGSLAGRSSAITNVSGVGSTIIQLVDTLDNTSSVNSSPVLNAIPTPYFCTNNPDNYNPAAVDPDGDVLNFALVAAVNNTSGSCSGTSTAGAVTYIGGTSATAPIASTSSFSFDRSTGQVSFNTNTAQIALVVYNVREFRGGVLVGTSQREMSFITQACAEPPPTGVISGATNGVIVDTTHFLICENTGAFSFDINPTELDTTYQIYVSASGIPTGATFTVVNDSTNQPTGTFSWTSTGTPPGSYTFYVTFQDNGCPVAGTNTIAYTVTVDSTPIITNNNPVCVLATLPLIATPISGTWVSGNTAVATIGTSSGVVTGVSQGTSIVTYSYSLAGCSATAIVTVNPIPSAITGPTAVCVGSNISLSDVSSGGTWISSNTSVATVGSGTGIVGGVASGTATISYKFTLTSCYVTYVVTVNPLPSDINGTLNVCVGSCSSLSDLTAGGTWASSNAGVASVGSTGTVCGISAGTTIITYALSTGCLKTRVFTVNPVPAVITGSTGVCVGSTINLTDASAGGTWTSSNTSVATVGTSGTVTGVSLGTSIITYAFATGCRQTVTVTVNTTPVPIAGTFSVCATSSTTLSDATSGGAWSSSNGAVATVGTGGTVTGVSAGTSIISYSLGTGCLVTAVMTVYPTPAAITGSSNVCVGFTTSLTDASAGGTWSSSNTSIATVGTGGVVSGVAPGTAVISYAFATGCSQVFVITVNLTPSAILGTPVMCVGATTSLSDATGVGTWTTSNAGVATVSSTGVAGGVSAGTAIISYSLGTGCSVTIVATVNPNPAAITPAGVTVCMGSATSLTDATASGVWSSSNSGIATVGGTGTVGGVATGTATISYTLLTGCYAVNTVTVNLTPVAITPAAPAVCVGSTVSLSDGTGGGVWSSGNTAIATINAATGSAGGVSAGTVAITYSIGSCFTTTTLSVNANPVAITPSGAVSICVGAATSLTDASAGGAWSSSNNSIATVGATGIVTGVASGVVNISYTNASGCSVIKTVTVSITPTAIVPASTVVCQGSTVSLTDGVGGGVWASGNTAIATVGATGVTGGVSAGATTISYTIGSCFAVASVTVNPLPGAGSVSGPSNLCAGATGSYTDIVGGGVWSSSSTAIATIDPSSGIATAVSGGTVTISYSVTNSCGTAVATMVVTVTPTGAGIITGPSTICAGTFVVYTESISGGTWSLSNTNATITGTGLLTGIAVGTDILTYSVTNICGTFSTTRVITIGPFLTAGSISGSSFVCAGSVITLSDAASGGLWSSSNTALATVGTGSGIVSGVSGGVDTIYYTVTASCGAAVASHVVTVVPAPNAGGISGSAIICAGSALTYTETVSGGVWSVANATATISSAGLLTAVSPGTNIISYTVTNSCGTAVATKTINIGAFLTAGAISGPASVCQGSTITLSDVVSGGVWSSGATAVATVGTAGVVTGVSVGTTLISYTVTSACGSVTATQTITVNPLPNAGSIAGPSNLCIGSSSIFTDAAAGGVWSVSNATATITSGGLATPVTIGTNIISYTVTNSCGTAVASQSVTIGIAPSSSTITGGSNVCIGTPLSLTDPVAGGAWSSSNGTATVSGAGVVSGVTPGVDTISYIISNACGTSIASKTITVSPAADAGTISGPSTICAGTFTILSDAASGGIWNSSNATATITSTGILTGVIPGIDTISYTVINTCGIAVATKIVTIGSPVSAGSISGPGSVCMGSSITLSDAVAGGLWTSSNTHATAGSSTGIVTGITAGIDTVYYTVSGSCGTASAMAVITVNPLPAAGTITGAVNMCVGSTAVLSDLTSGGVWSSSDASVAAIDASGNISALTVGSSTISYTVTNACGTATTTQTENVNPLPTVSAITGTTHECVGAASALADVTIGGIWSSSNTAIATAGSSSGIVTGVSAGTVNINYTVTNTFGCSASVSVLDTVISSASIAAITGVTHECTGAASSFSDATPGGVWSSSNTAIATIDPSTGIATGVAPGSVSIMYTVSGSGCPSVASIADTVIAIPSSSPIGGTLSVCAGSTITLTDAASGGAWSSGSSSVASVGPSTGIVTGITPGVAIISYSVSNTCGAAVSTAAVTVNPLPSAGTITSALSNVCVGSAISLSDAVTGGVWSSSNTAVAMVGSTGSVTGVASGTATIMYSVTNSSGCTNRATINISVGGSLPAAAVNPAGSATLCHGAPLTLHIVSSGTGLTYQWYHNGTAIPGATGSSYTTVTTGYFSAIVSNGACSESVTGTTVVAPPNAVISFTPPNVLSTGLYSAYQWYLNGVAIPGAHSNSINLTGTGAYVVVVTDGNGCIDTSAAYIITSGGGGGGGNTGVTNIDGGNVKVYPNPATSVLHIDAPVKVNVSVLSIDGKVLIEQKDAETIDVSRLANGLYIVMVYDENNLLLKTTKFAKTE
jgi:trimeric autotransporter adhesin